jgi:hypothetical protein
MTEGLELLAGRVVGGRRPCMSLADRLFIVTCGIVGLMAGVLTDPGQRPALAVGVVWGLLTYGIMWDKGRYVR